MASVFLDSPMLWGVGGAAIYALPRLSACVFASRQAGTGWGLCAFEAMIALLIGCLAAGAFGPYVAGVLKADTEASRRAIDAMIGLLANPTAPAVIDVLSGRVLTMLKGSDK